MQLIEQIRKELKSRQASVLTLSKETGITAYKIYKWLDGKANPKHEDSQKLEKWLSGEVEEVPRVTNTVHEAEVLYSTKNPDSKPGQASEAVLLREIIKLKDQIIDMQSKENLSLQQELGALKETTSRIDGKVDGCNRLIMESNSLSKEANQLMIENNGFLKKLEGLAALADVARNQDSSETQDLNNQKKKHDGKGSRANNRQDK